VSGLFDVIYEIDGDDFFLAVSVGCLIRKTPFDADLVGFSAAGPGTTTSRTLTVTNTTATALTITRFAFVAPTAFTAQLHGGVLPITVPPEGTFALDVAFAPTLPASQRYRARRGAGRWQLGPHHRGVRVVHGPRFARRRGRAQLGRARRVPCATAGFRHACAESLSPGRAPAGSDATRAR
jgi:hypothetical protein